MLKISRSRGFSMIELMIGIVIMATLIALGFPAYTTYLENTKLLSAAESFMTGVQLARSEAVRRNTPVEFVLTPAMASVDNKETTSYSAQALNWMVRVPLASGLHTFVEGKSGIQDSSQSQGSTLHVTVDGGTVALPITFNGLGATTLATQANFNFKNLTGGACAPGGPIRCLRVVVAVGGRARMCDPAAPASDTRTC